MSKDTQLLATNNLKNSLALFEAEEDIKNLGPVPKSVKNIIRFNALNLPKKF